MNPLTNPLPYEITACLILAVTLAHVVTLVVEAVRENNR